MEMHDRIRELRKNYLHMSQAAFGSKLGVNRDVINNIENNRLAKPEQKLSLIKLMCREFSVNEEWLLNGTEPMIAQPETFSLDQYLKERGCTALEMEIVKAYFELDMDTRQKVFNHFQARLSAAKELAGEQTSHVTGLARSYQSSTRLRAVQKYLAKPIPVQIYQADMDAGEAGISAMALDSLIAAVEKNDKQGIRDAVPAVFGAIGADANFELLRINMDYLLYKLVRLACERDRAVNQTELLQHLQKNLLHHGGIIPGKFERLTQFVQEYADYLSSLQRDGNDSILLRVEQDIRLHYKENLTLKELSRKYYVNSAYLGQLFKKKYGITFREYLNNCRIEQSAKLLLSTRDKVYNIAKAVGYQDMDYFIERFIAAKGCTPSNYRKTNGV